MNYLKLSSLTLAAVLAMSVAHAQESDDLDGMEMDVVESGESPEQMSQRLALPDEASDEGKANSSFGLDTANAAREGRAEFGRETAEQSRERRGRPEGVPSGAPEGTPTGAPEGVPGQ
jgi:hypothetical protein